jgi:GTP-binding protein
MHGRNGKELIIKVPCGTEVWNMDSGTMIGEVLQHGQELLVARGGKADLGISISSLQHIAHRQNIRKVNPEKN